MPKIFQKIQNETLQGRHTFRYLHQESPQESAWKARRVHCSGKAAPFSLRGNVFKLYYWDISMNYFKASLVILKLVAGKKNTCFIDIFFSFYVVEKL